MPLILHCYWHSLDFLQVRAARLKPRRQMDNYLRNAMRASGDAPGSPPFRDQTLRPVSFSERTASAAAAGLTSVSACLSYWLNPRPLSDAANRSVSQAQNSSLGRVMP